MDNRIVRITAEVVASIQGAARTAWPEECCGLLSGSDAVITNAYPLRNESPKPQTRYFASPEDLLAAMRRIRDAKQTMMGIYHSHPRTTAYPSLSDVEMAFYPEAVYFIISLEPRVDLRAFEIDRRRIQEVEISVLPAY